ncbi:MAG TPA: flp pilus-assembly TadE/G-like family protein [Nocardioides sp.]|uniref:Rv3654c family TadE-like protein n=1 Tax=Nocardioides sp. TaxID=35761 RepID=UPI002B7DD61E|nr:Rv3654c family TadE-like protein [Nocardioides sp.]HQR28649.1 flp pilus-assembly TadE/G-like family protein [Nocardioides sp.]
MSRDEHGAATVLVVTFLAVLVLLTAALAAVEGMVAAHRRAQSAADLAALAAARSLGLGQDPCPDATRIAEANGARLTACAVEGRAVAVEVAVDGPRWLGRATVLAGQARAGPG